MFQASILEDCDPNFQTKYKKQTVCFSSKWTGRFYKTFSKLQTRDCMIKNKFLKSDKDFDANFTD